MIDKFVATRAEAVADVADGATVLVGGFGTSGQPVALLEALADQGATGLTVVCNNAGTGERGLGRLIGLGRVAKLIASYPRGPHSQAFEQAYAAGRIAFECVPQGTLAERLRAAGAGLGGFYTPTGYGTALAKGKETRVIDGRGYVVEWPLPGDVALVGADSADRWGNLTYRLAARNFNPVMCTAARVTVAEARSRVELGAIAPEHVVTPGLFVQRVVVTSRAEERGAA